MALGFQPADHKKRWSVLLGVGWAGMVLVTHVPFYREIFAIPEFLRDPLLCFGFQEFDKGASLDGKQYLHLGEYFATLGVRATVKYRPV